MLEFSSSVDLCITLFYIIIVLSDNFSVISQFCDISTSDILLSLWLLLLLSSQVFIIKSIFNSIKSVSNNANIEKLFI